LHVFFTNQEKKEPLDRFTRNSPLNKCPYRKKKVGVGFPKQKQEGHRVLPGPRQVVKKSSTEKTLKTSTEKKRDPPYPPGEKIFFLKKRNQTNKRKNPAPAKVWGRKTNSPKDRGKKKVFFGGGVFWLFLGFPGGKGEGEGPENPVGLLFFFKKTPFTMTKKKRDHPRPHQRARPPKQKPKTLVLHPSKRKSGGGVGFPVVEKKGKAPPWR